MIILGTLAVYGGGVSAGGWVGLALTILNGLGERGSITALFGSGSVLSTSSWGSCSINGKSFCSFGWLLYPSETFCGLGNGGVCREPCSSSALELVRAILLWLGASLNLGFSCGEGPTISSDFVFTNKSKDVFSLTTESEIVLAIALSSTLLGLLFFWGGEGASRFENVLVSSGRCRSFGYCVSSGLSISM